MRPITTEGPAPSAGLATELWASDLGRAAAERRACKRTVEPLLVTSLFPVPGNAISNEPGVPLSR